MSLGSTWIGECVGRLLVNVTLNKGNLSSSRDLNPEPSITSQTLLPLSHWDSGIGAEDIH